MTQFPEPVPANCYKVAYIIARDILMSMRRDVDFFFRLLIEFEALPIKSVRLFEMNTHDLFIDIDSLVNRNRKFMSWCQMRLIETRLRDWVC